MSAFDGVAFADDAFDVDDVGPVVTSPRFVTGEVIAQSLTADAVALMLGAALEVSAVTADVDVQSAPPLSRDPRISTDTAPGPPGEVEISPAALVFELEPLELTAEVTLNEYEDS